MSRSILPALLVLSLVLAGCNGLVGGDEMPEQTLTPAPVPTAKSTPTPIPQLAPGLTGNGVTNPFVLAEAHAAILNGTSYTFYRNATVRYTNSTVFNRFTVHTQVGATDSRFYKVVNGFGITVRGSGTLSIWSNGEHVFRALTSNNRTTYTIPRNANGEPASPQEAFREHIGASSPPIAALFSSVETRVVGSITRNGTTLYRVVATDVTDSAAFMGQNSSNITFRALISSRGLVREYHLSYTATLNNNTVHINRHIRYTDIGNTTIERPPWYDEAIENTTMDET